VNPTTLEVLEFGKVLERIAAHAVTPLGKDFILERTPLTEQSEIFAFQSRVTEAKALINANKSAPISAILDQNETAEQGAKGVVLPPEALWQAGVFLKVIRLVKEFLRENEKHAASFSPLEKELKPAPALEKRIFESINAAYEILDSASLKLANLRIKIRGAHQGLMAKLQNLMQSSKMSTMLQEPIITQRAGRYVIPIKETHHKEFKGILHDRSSSGATLFMEPLQIVDQNNQLLELKLQEKTEEEAVLRAISEMLGQQFANIKASSRALAEIDGAFASARWSREVRGVAPLLSGTPSLHLEGARHPLLGERAVPIDVEIGQTFRTLIITGPNTGGKTVSLKTIGLFTALAQSGFHLPAEKASVGIFRNILADIGDEQSIEQNLSTFSSHISKIISFIPKANEHSLVLLDELGAGTDPREGAALGMALLTYFHGRQTLTSATTHYPELKIFAEKMDGMMNASMTFNDETLEPTYRLALGKPGRSLALAIAKRLGLSESILEDAKRRLDQESLRVEDLLVTLEKKEAELNEAHSRFSQAQTAFAAKQEEESKRIVRELEKAQELLHQSQEWLKDKKETLKTASLKEVEAAETELETIGAKLDEQLEAAGVPGKELQIPLNRQEAKAGNRVWIESLERHGIILETKEKTALIQLGSMQVERPYQDLRLEPAEEHLAEDFQFHAFAHVNPEIDLRGLRAEEAIARVEKYLDQVLLSSLSTVQLIHGKGEGILRKAIHAILEEHPQVKNFRLGDLREGGEGVTIVELHA